MTSLFCKMLYINLIDHATKTCSSGGFGPADGNSRSISQGSDDSQQQVRRDIVRAPVQDGRDAGPGCFGGFGDLGMRQSTAPDDLNNPIV